MKKFFMILMAVVCLTEQMLGQNPAKDNIIGRPVGDTILGPDNDIYFGPFNWLDTSRSDIKWEWNITDFYVARHLQREPDYNINMVREFLSHCIGTMYAGNGVYGNQLYTDRPLSVIGICAAAFAQSAADTTTERCLSYLTDRCAPYWGEEYYVRNTLDESLESRATDSLILYKLTDNGPQWLASGPWRAEDPHRSILLKDSTDLERRPFSWYTKPYSTDSIVPLYEVTFKSPIIVTDSFMVAGTALNNMTSRVYVELPHSQPNRIDSDSMNLWQVRPTRYWGISNGYYPKADYDSLGPTGVWIKYPNPDGNWRFITHHSEYFDFFPDIQTIAFMTYCIFPIIDTTFDSLVCDLVTSVHAAEITDTSVTLMWNGGNNVEWEVRHKKMGGGDVVVATTTAPTYTITGLEPNTSYYVWVRARCDSLHEFGPWSDVDTVTTQQGQGQTTEKIDNLDRYTQLMPNPAGSVVNVTSSFGLRRIVVYDLQGHAVLEHKCSGTSATFSVAGLADGVYVVALHTPYGMATKRLVVQR